MDSLFLHAKKSVFLKSYEFSWASVPIVPSIIPDWFPDWNLETFENKNLGGFPLTQQSCQSLVNEIPTFLSYINEIEEQPLKKAFVVLNATIDQENCVVFVTINEVEENPDLASSYFQETFNDELGEKDSNSFNKWSDAVESDYSEEFSPLLSFEAVAYRQSDFSYLTYLKENAIVSDDEDDEMSYATKFEDAFLEKQLLPEQSRQDRICEKDCSSRNEAFLFIVFSEILPYLDDTFICSDIATEKQNINFNFLYILLVGADGQELETSFIEKVLLPGLIQVENEKNSASNEMKN